MKYYAPMMKFNVQKIRNVLIKKCIIKLLKQSRIEKHAE